MTALQKSCEKLSLEEHTCDHERSILLVDIMNAIGFSKSEREINRHWMHLENVMMTVFKRPGKDKITITGSRSEGMCAGVYGNQSCSDYDFLITAGNIKLYTPRTNNINNPPLLLLDDNEDYDVSDFVDEDNNFPGYVNLSLTEMKSNCGFLNQCRRMNDCKLYLLNHIFIDSLYNRLFKPLKNYDGFSFPSTKKKINGPALAIDIKDFKGETTETDNVHCIHYDMWPNSANSFITRCKPNNWPSNSMLEDIKRQGCEVASVVHHESENNDIQWRISFPGEQTLFFDLSHVQILCYALIKIILKANLNTSQREVVSSFHIKHVIFWCVERCSCQWVDSNSINCLNICLAKLIQMITAKHIPHYFIESRNLFNSKMTEKLSTEIVDILSKYDTAHVFTLDAFESVTKITHYNNALLKHATLHSTIHTCFGDCLDTFYHYVSYPSLFYSSYIQHNGTQSLLNYVKILQNLKKNKGMGIQFAKYLFKSMIGFLYYVKYKESNKAEFLLESKRLIHKSLKLKDSCVKLRAATFFLANLNYRKSIEICDAFLTFPQMYKKDSYKYTTETVKFIFHLLEGKTTEELENIMTEILPMIYNSVKLKYFPGSYNITQQTPVGIFRNLTNIFFGGLYMDITFMTAEKLAVPDPILYELLSLSQDAEFPFSGIHLDPMFVSIQTKFLCYHSIGNVNGMAEMLISMNSLVTDRTFTTNISYVYLNMLVYCLIKAGHHRQSVKSILQSLHIFPSRYNAASGYLRIVLQILNSLSI